FAHDVRLGWIGGESDSRRRCGAVNVFDSRRQPGGVFHGAQSGGQHLGYVAHPHCGWHARNDYAGVGIAERSGERHQYSVGRVQGAVVTVGPNGAPDYRLSLTAAKLGAVTIDLSDSSGSLIAESHAGAAATYEVEGSATPLSSDSRTITLAPGLTVDLLGASASSDFATITVKNDASSLASAFSVFAQA